MEITWLGHSCFRLRSNNLAIVTDPFPDSNYMAMGDPQALAVTVSHQHANHNFSEGVEGEPKVLTGPGEYELSGNFIRGVMTSRGESDPSDKRNTAYLIEMENLKVCHLGDVSSALSTRQVEELTPVDVLLLPVGGICTVEIPQAIEIMRNLDPRVIVPMHYQVPGVLVGLMSLDIFLREMGLRDVQPQARLNVTTSTLPQETQVIVLEAQGLKNRG